MKKKIFYIIIIIISLIIPTNVLAKSTTSALVEIDVNKKGSLVITYDYNDYQFDDTNVSIYQVAEVSNNFQYQLLIYDYLFHILYSLYPYHFTSYNKIITLKKLF